MSYVKPEPGRYRRLKDGAEVTVTGCTGTEWNSNVAVQGARLSHVRLENFWKKYEPLNNDAVMCWRCGSTPSTGICCSSHNKALCHRDYRLTHFVERCVEGCTECATEGLPLALTGKTVTS